VGIALLDAHTFHIITANRCFRDLFANTVMEGKQIHTANDRQDLVDFFSAPSFPLALELFQSVKETGQTYQGQEFPVLHPERGMTYWNGSITPLFSQQGSVDRLLSTASDVTEQARTRLLAAKQQDELPKSDAELLRLAAVEAVSTSVGRELRSEGIARVAIEALVASLDPLCAYIHLAQPSTQELRLAHLYIDERVQGARSLREIAPDLQRVTYNSSHWIARARHRKEPILLPRLPQLSSSQNEHPSQTFAQSGYICLPLWFQDHFEGTLVVLFRETRYPDRLLVRTLEDCGASISASLAHSRLLDEVERERARLRAVLDHLPEGVLLVEADKRSISYANEAAVRILGEPGERLHGLPIEHISALSQNHFSLTQKGNEEHQAHIPLWRALAGETTLGREVQFTRPDGRAITLLVATAPVWNHAQMITGAVSIFQDISVRKSIEQQKNDFLSIASHELRTPITAIQGFAEILQMFAEQHYDPEESRTLQIIENILEQSSRLTSLINEMLDISRVEHGQLIMHPAPHDLLATLKHAVASMAVTERNRSILMTIQGLEADAVLPVVFDEERILQVLSNFITNAMKYSPLHSPIEVGLQYEQARPDRVRLWVRDRGIGIPPSDLPHIFERFHRAENFDRSISGLGIGLYLAREIILRHGGSIWAESQEGKGSTFSVELPLPSSEEATPRHTGKT
jgi:PAS domain S-box-containing protein